MRKFASSEPKNIKYSFPVISSLCMNITEKKNKRVHMLSM